MDPLLELLHQNSNIRREDLARMMNLSEIRSFAMDVGETVGLVSDVDGMPAGKEGRVLVDMLLVGCRSAHGLDLVCTLE